MQSTWYAGDLPTSRQQAAEPLDESFANGFVVRDRPIKRLPPSEVTQSKRYGDTDNFAACQCLFIVLNFSIWNHLQLCLSATPL